MTSSNHPPQGLLPVLALKNTVVFPGLTQMLRVGREKSIKALRFAEKNDRWIVAVLQKHTGEDEALSRDSQIMANDLLSIGTLCKVESIKGNTESGYQVLLKGVARTHLENHLDSDQGFITADSTLLEDQNDMNPATQEAVFSSLKSLSKETLKLLPGNTKQIEELVDTNEDLGHFTYLAAGNLEFELGEKQKVLETRNLRERALFVLQLIQEAKENLNVQNEIRSKLNQKFGQMQRQTILREQLRTIREELGEEDTVSAEEALEQKIADSGMPEETMKVAEKELKRLGEIGAQSPESHIIRNYLDLLTALPWNKSSSQEEIDLDESRKILDADHYGLDKVKKRIIQHLAVMKLKKQNKGSILLFVGPPGVGKTSLGQSIAKALGRKFTRVSLGGVRDDAEVRGHRRTYIGAMPGRIIQGLKRAGENNPVFLLDEIDKMSRAFSGDPAAALLEVLDPEQNATFLDHYLDVAFDLSKVFFIATANSLESIPGPLLDRMEIIDLTGYTTAEKTKIAEAHLIPDQLKEHGIEPQQLSIPAETLQSLIAHYTREAGVRDLQRKITALIRGSSEKILLNKEAQVVVNKEDLEEILGDVKFTHEVTDTINPPGVVTGLAWTPVGGDILFVEASSMPGQGKLMITGQLGDVMKESAQIAHSLIRTYQAQLGSLRDLSKTDLHVHIPAGAIPKDGPSAGVTMLTALSSLISGRKVSPKMAMTGEISLRGAVLPVGGIKEKVIAAHRAGAKVIILPKKNQKDLKEIPDEVKSTLEFHFAENISELLKVALGVELNMDWLAPTDATTPHNNWGTA